MKLPATAVLFCGGRSTRMGRDKAFLDWHGRPLALHVAARIAPLFDLTVVSGDPATYRSLDLACIPDRGGSGPLAGLYAGLLAARTEAIFAIACDMPLVEPAEILALWKRLPGFDAAVPVHAGGAESLHAFYTKRVLPAVGRALSGRSSMPSWWGECPVAQVDASGWKGLADCDSVADYQKLLSAGNS